MCFPAFFNISLSSDKDEPVNLLNPCGKPHGSKICGECINVLAQASHFMGKHRSTPSIKKAKSSQSQHQGKGIP